MPRHSLEREEDPKGGFTDTTEKAFRVHYVAREYPPTQTKGVDVAYRAPTHAGTCQGVVKRIIGFQTETTLHLSTAGLIKRGLKRPSFLLG